MTGMATNLITISLSLINPPLRKRELALCVANLATRHLNVEKGIGEMVSLLNQIRIWLKQMISLLCSFLKSTLWPIGKNGLQILVPLDTCGNKDTFMTYMWIKEGKETIYLGDSYTTPLLGKRKVLLKLTFDNSSS